VCSSDLSMTPRHAERLTEVALAALQATGCRGVLQAGWAGLGAGAVADDVYAVTEIPHDWLFPQMAAVVHHGGAGTTAAALRAGVPAIITPLFADQPLWGARVAALGVGPAPMPLRQVTAERLAAAIRQATRDSRMKARAVVLGERIRSEQGVLRAVEAFHQHVAHTGRLLSSR